MILFTSVSIKNYLTAEVFGSALPAALPAFLAAASDFLASSLEAGVVVAPLSSAAGFWLLAAPTRFK